MVLLISKQVRLLAAAPLCASSTARAVILKSGAAPLTIIEINDKSASSTRGPLKGWLIKIGVCAGRLFSLHPRKVRVLLRRVNAEMAFSLLSLLSAAACLCMPLADILYCVCVKQPDQC